MVLMNDSVNDTVISAVTIVRTTDVSKNIRVKAHVA